MTDAQLPLTLGPEELRTIAKQIARPDSLDSHWCHLAAVLGRITDEHHYRQYRDPQGQLYERAQVYAAEELDIGYERYMELIRLWRLMQSSRAAVPMTTWFQIRKGRALLLRKVLSLGGDVTTWLARAQAAPTLDAFRQEVQAATGDDPWTTITVAAPVTVADLFDEALATKLRGIEPDSPRERVKDRDIRFQLVEAIARDAIDRAGAAMLLNQLRSERGLIDRHEIVRHDREGVSMTHTYAVLEVSRGAFEEIRTKLEAAGYADQFHEDEDGMVIDLHGIAIRSE